MDCLKRKRLLLLGGSLWKNAIKQFADENEIILIATGNDQSARFFDIASEKYEVNSTDPQLMKKFIIEKEIDGVYMGGSEVVIGRACKYLEELGMPCYCRYDQWECLQNKKKFKELCMANDLPVVPQYNIDGLDISLCEECFPVITKPADSCGSSGFSVCNNNEELIRGYKIAADNSSTGSVIVEKFVENQANVVFYTVSDGQIFFSGLSDKYPVKHEKQGSYVGGLFLYESKYTEEFRKLFENKIQNLVSFLGIKEGTFWIEVFHHNDKYYFNESGYRYGGSGSIYPTNYFFGINQVASDIYYALTGKSLIKGHQSMIPVGVPKKTFYAIYPIHINPGIIKEICGVNDLDKHPLIVANLVTKSIGAEIADSGTFAQAFCLIHIVFDNFNELEDVIEYIHNKLYVFDTNGHNMIKRMLDLNRIKSEIN